ncbi:MAG: T9SS type A sorting domain-containing protein [Phaeodactylibacter sp.]|nr:T9SS type A sorting domain-containing protein [Phaeodactylibacter sp.]
MMNFKTFTQLTLSLLFCLSLGNAALAQNVFYTEDFAGGFPNDWTSVEVVGNGQPSSVWVYTTAGPTGPFATAALASTTAGNGWMLFDSDTNCNHPEGQDAWLISPAIDGSGLTEVWLQFETYFRTFNDRPQIRVGTDLNDLSSWATIEVFPGISVNEFGGVIVGDETLNPQTINLNLTPYAAGVNGFHFAFQFLSDSSTGNGGNLTGCGYNWQVDDVALLDSNPIPLHDLVVSRPRLAPNFAQPYTQVDTVRMAARIDNLGQLNQTNVSITADISGDNGDNFSTTETTDLLESDSATLFLLDQTFVPNGTQGIYSLTYTVAADSTDLQPSNNTIETEFVISEDLYQKDNGNFDFSTGPAEVDGETWQVGNYYYVPNGGYEAYEAEFSIASDNSSHQGQSVNVFLYEINEDDDPASFTDEDVELLGFATHTFTDEANGDLVTVTLTDLLTAEEGVELQEGGEYLLMVEYLPEMRGIFSDMPADYDVATVVNNNGWFLGGFTGDAIVVARMRIRSVESAVGNVQIAKANIKLFPNPVTDYLTANIELENASKQMEVRVLNTNGQAVATQSFDNTKGETVRFDARSFTTGTYFLQIRTEEGVKTERFAVQR